MELKVKIKPSKFVGDSKESVLTKAYLSGWTIGSSGSRYIHGSNTLDEEFVYVINLTKFRRKTKQTQKINKVGVNSTESVILRKTHWVGYRYRIPVALLKELNLKVEQGKRTFKLVKRK